MKRDDIVIRGMRNGILVSFDDSLDMDIFFSRLTEQLEDPEVQPLFGSGQVILDLGARDVSNIKMTELADVFSSHGLSLQRIIARPDVGPPIIVDHDKNRSKKRGSLSRAVSDEAWPVMGEEGEAKTVKTETAVEVMETRTEAREESKIYGNNVDGDGNTLLIQRNLRSGQTVEYHGNVVIMGDVNPGAEIVAGGNIIVLGSFRGIAHAGASGDESSTVTAFRLRPTQLRIAGHITRAPDGDEAGPEIPEIARIREGVVVIERYQ